MSEVAKGNLTEKEFQFVAEWLFINSMVDLEMRVNYDLATVNRYHLLGIASILRKLLLDGDAVAVLVNRAHRLPLRFNMNPFSITHEDAVGHIRDTGLDPSGYSYGLFYGDRLMPSEDSPGEVMNLKQFLGAQVGLVDGRGLSVREVIKFFANVEGGVHLGAGKNPVEKSLMSTVPSAISSPGLGNMLHPIATLKFLGQVTKIALLPLMTKCSQEAQPSSPGYAIQGENVSWGMFGGDGSELNRES